MLGHIEAADIRLVDLLYLAPPWCSGHGTWSARAISAVWVGTHRGVEVMLFVADDGAEFCGALLDIQPEEVRSRRLICEMRRSRLDL